MKISGCLQHLWALWSSSPRSVHDAQRQQRCLKVTAWPALAVRVGCQILLFVCPLAAWHQYIQPNLARLPRAAFYHVPQKRSRASALSKASVTVRQVPRRRFLLTVGAYIQYTSDVQTEPDHVHKVPVPSGTFKAEVFICREGLLQAQRDEQQHQTCRYHVETVAGQHEEGRTEHTRRSFGS